MHQLFDYEIRIPIGFFIEMKLSFKVTLFSRHFLFKLVPFFVHENHSFQLRFSSNLVLLITCKNGSNDRLSRFCSIIFRKLHNFYHFWLQRYIIIKPAVFTGLIYSLKIMLTRKMMSKILSPPSPFKSASCNSSFVGLPTRIRLANAIISRIFTASS